MGYNKHNSKFSILLLISLIFLFQYWVYSTLDRSEDPDLRVMTFNIRNSYARDGENDWKHRKELVYQTIRDYSPAILGLQEANHVQQNELLAELPEYEFVGIGAKGGTKGQYCSILYLKNRFKVEKTETHWLSYTPTVPSSTWGNHHLRIFTFARLVEKQPGISSMFTTATWTMVRKKHEKKAWGKLESIFSCSQAISPSSSWGILMRPKTV